MPKRHALVLLLVFLLSVGVRIPQLGRPLSKNHEFCTAVALIVLDVWWQRGFSTCMGSPAVTYEGACAGVSGSLTSALVQRDQVRYYVSHMPLAYWVPYAAATALGSRHTPFSIRVFNLLLHGATAYFLYRFLASLTVAAAQPGLSDVPLFAAVLYLLMPATLWYHGNVYMSDMAVQLPWAWSLAAGARLFGKDKVRLRRSGWFLLAIAATALTEWLGLLVALTFAAYAVVRGLRRHDRAALALGILCLGTALLAMGGALWLYARIAGPDALWAYYMGRWDERGSWSIGEAGPAWGFLRAYPVHVLTVWGPLVLLLPGALLLWAWPRMRIGLGPWAWMVVPACLHMLVFLRYAGHEFSVLKLGFALCTLGAAAVVGLRKRGKFLSNLALLAACLLGPAMYTVVNRPGDGSATGDRYDLAKRRGTFIANTATTGERIWVSGAAVEPQLIYYAKRNADAVPPERSDLPFRRWASGPCAAIWFKFNGDSCTVERWTPE